MKKGWLARGLQSAKTDAEKFPEYRVKALSQHVEFFLKPSSSTPTKDARAKSRAKLGAKAS